jgi:hypothetical protein
MSVQIQIDTTKLEERMRKMITRLDHFRRVDIGMGLSQWQVEDLGRDRPFTMRSRAKGLATTKIRPHSLYEMERSARSQSGYYKARRKYEEKWLAPGRKRRKRKPKYVLMVERHQPKTSTRPILRSMARDKLRERMRDMLQQKLTWR